MQWENSGIHQKDESEQNITENNNNSETVNKNVNSDEETDSLPTPPPVLMTINTRPVVVSPLIFQKCARSRGRLPKKRGGAPQFNKNLQIPQMEILCQEEPEEEKEKILMMFNSPHQLIKL